MKNAIYNMKESIEEEDRKIYGDQIRETEMLIPA